MKNCHSSSHCALRTGHHYGADHTTTMINRINNAICLLIAAAVFAMIGIESGAHHSPTHSGTQQVVQHD